MSFLYAPTGEIAIRLTSETLRRAFTLVVRARVSVTNGDWLSNYVRCHTAIEFVQLDLLNELHLVVQVKRE